MRKCGNPDCNKVWDDDHVTICLKCGWGTGEYKKANVNSTEHRDIPIKSK